jgi:predicted Holliday junction resolvase-like endonuclease
MELFLIIILIISAIILVYLSYKLGSLAANLKWQKKIPQLQRLTADRQRAGIKGKVVEAFAPFLPGFPFKASECKFIGDPIDYLVFEGLDERNIKGVHLVEVKSSNSKLSKHQKQIKNILDKLNSDEVTFQTFNFKGED